MQVILFDIDGTLISSGGAGKAALEEGLREEFGIDHVLDKLDLSGRTDRAIIADIFVRLNLTETPELRARLFNAYLRRLPGCLTARAGSVLPGCHALLETLSGRTDVGLGLLTGNIRAGAAVKLGHFGLARYFAFGGFGDKHHERDDVARTAWQHVRNRYGDRVAPQDVWVVGDTPLDIRCARAIGARVVAVATGWHPVSELESHHPDVLLPDLTNAHGFFR